MFEGLVSGSVGRRGKFSGVVLAYRRNCWCLGHSLVSLDHLPHTRQTSWMGWARAQHVVPAVPACSCTLISILYYLPGSKPGLGSDYLQGYLLLLICPPARFRPHPSCVVPPSPRSCSDLLEKLLRPARPPCRQLCFPTFAGGLGRMLEEGCLWNFLALSLS